MRRIVLEPKQIFQHREAAEAPRTEDYPYEWYDVSVSGKDRVRAFLLTSGSKGRFFSSASWCDLTVHVGVVPEIEHHLKLLGARFCNVKTLFMSGEALSQLSSLLCNYRFPPWRLEKISEEVYCYTSPWTNRTISLKFDHRLSGKAMVYVCELDTAREEAEEGTLKTMNNLNVKYGPLLP